MYIIFSPPAYAGTGQNSLIERTQICAEKFFCDFSAVF
jgi:hypothetical protein